MEQIWILLALVTLAGASGDHSGAQTARLQAQSPLEVVVSSGDAAVFTCHVERGDGAAVVWVRSDLTVLGARGVRVTSDPRVTVRVDGDTHELELRDVTPADRAVYECQLATEPKTSLYYTLYVVDTESVQISVEGPAVRHASPHAELRLRCDVTTRDSPLAPVPVWYYEDESVSIQSAGVSLETWRGPRAGAELRLATTRAGRYECRAGGRVRGVLVRGADPQMDAMQRDGTPYSSTEALRSHTLLVLLLVLLLYYNT